MTLDPVRDARNRDVMAEFELDALLCRLPENVLLLTGYWPISGFAFALVPRDGPISLLVPETERAAVPDGAADEIQAYRSGTIDAPDPYESIGRYLADGIRRCRAERGRIGIELTFELVSAGHTGGEVVVPGAQTQAAIAAAAPHATLVDAAPLITMTRARKTPYEIAKIRRANQVAALGLEAFREAYEPGRTEAEVAARVEAAIMTGGLGFDGAEHVRSWAQLMTGPASAWAYSAHPATSARVIERGDLGVLELGTMVDGYWSDLTRTLVAGGAPDDRQREMYDAIVQAVQAVMHSARPGMTGAEVDGLARGEIDRRGFGDLFIHATGHGLGFRYHEPDPLLKPGNVGPIDEGMVSSVEPGLYIEGFGGMRLEENVVFGENGPELLSTFSTSLSASA